MKNIETPPNIKDTREQTPWAFKHSTVIQTLPVGDYSVIGMEKHVIIERKRFGEFYNCLTNDRERFEREILRAGEFLHRLHVIVEASLWQVITGTFDDCDYPSQANPAAIRGTIIAWEGRYPWVRFAFPGSRDGAILWADHILRKSWSDFVLGLTKK
jgi:ERCC4-type nuclease